VAVEKGTKPVISANFRACGERRFNNLRTTFVPEILGKEFFNSHACFQQLLRFVRDSDMIRLKIPASFQAQNGKRIDRIAL
jgi:hypothetical protein